MKFKLVSGFALLVVVALIGTLMMTFPSYAQTTPTATPTTAPTTTTTTTNQTLSSTLNCTFTAGWSGVNIRTGPALTNRVVANVRPGQTAAVVGETLGRDGYIWWHVSTGWLRSDLGTSNCPAVCGNLVCESGEVNGSCTQDCGSTGRFGISGAGANTGTSSTDTTAGTQTNTSTTTVSCLVEDCQSCYESISCYPNCSECTCARNSYGCPTCQCDEPTVAENGCTYESCEACIAAFPCWGGQACTQTQCTLNENGCPVCSTAP
jgi:hypothetical protein